MSEPAYFRSQRLFLQPDDGLGRHFDADFKMTGSSMKALYGFNARTNTMTDRTLCQLVHTRLGLRCMRMGPC